MSKLQEKIEKAWDDRDELKPGGPETQMVDQAVSLLDEGDLRVAEKRDGKWHLNTWLKKAVLLYFRLHENRLIGKRPTLWYDKVPMKFEDWSENRFRQSGIRAVPGSFVRFGAYVGKGAVLMPSYVNIGAYVGDGTMVDTWATVGSCAQIGRNVHISGGAGIGGVLEPLQANPVIIEDDCFIGARSEVAEGVKIGKGSVLSMGVYLARSTPIVDRKSGDISYGEVPPYSVIIPGTLPPKSGKEESPATYAAVIVKQVDAKTREKTSINELLRP